MTRDGSGRRPDGSGRFRPDGSGRLRTAFSRTGDRDLLRRDRDLITRDRDFNKVAIAT